MNRKGYSRSCKNKVGGNSRETELENGLETEQDQVTDGENLREYCRDSDLDSNSSGRLMVEERVEVLISDTDGETERSQRDLENDTNRMAKSGAGLPCDQKGQVKDAEEPSEASFAKKTPTCPKCRIHEVMSLKKGHKGKCRFEKCFCPKCTLINEKREVLRQQVNNRRRLKTIAGSNCSQVWYIPPRRQPNQAEQSSWRTYPGVISMPPKVSLLTDIQMRQLWAQIIAYRRLAQWLPLPPSISAGLQGLRPFLPKTEETYREGFPSSVPSSYTFTHRLPLPPSISAGPQGLSPLPLKTEDNEEETNNEGFPSSVPSSCTSSQRLLLPPSISAGLQGLSPLPLKTEDNEEETHNEGFPFSAPSSCSSSQRVPQEALDEQSEDTDYMSSFQIVPEEVLEDHSEDTDDMSSS